MMSFKELSSNEVLFMTNGDWVTIEEWFSKRGLKMGKVRSADMICDILTCIVSY